MDPEELEADLLRERTRRLNESPLWDPHSAEILPSWIKVHTSLSPTWGKQQWVLEVTQHTLTGDTDLSAYCRDIIKPP